jgi:hypothetical protein
VAIFLGSRRVSNCLLKNASDKERHSSLDRDVFTEMIMIERDLFPIPTYRVGGAEMVELRPQESDCRARSRSGSWTERQEH